MEDNSQKILTVLRSLLRPLARFCLRYSIPLQAITEQIKIALIEVAAEELKENSEKINISRLSVKTGLHRKDVTRLYKGKGAQTGLDKDIARKVIGLWTGSKHYLGPDGRPCKLPYKDSSQISFHDLVSSISKDTDAKAVLVCLEGLKIVKCIDNEVELLTDMYVVQDDTVRGYELLARDVGNLTQAVEENIHDKEPVPNLHARTHYDNLLVSELPRIRKWILEQGVRYHREVRDYLIQYDIDIHPGLKGKGGARVTFGTFSLSKEKK